MLFDGLANFIVKRHRVIIVLWIVALAACIPLFPLASKVTSGQTEIGNASGQSAVAQSIIDSKFSSSSGSALFVVITANNVTTPQVRGFVQALTRSASNDSALSNFTGVGNTYSSVAMVINGATAAEQPIRSGAAELTQLFFGVPTAFINFWKLNSSESPTAIPQATAMTSAFFTKQVQNSTELAASQLYLQQFSQALAASYQASPSTPVQQRISSVVNATGAGFVSSVIPAAERPLATSVLKSFSLTNYADPNAIETFVVAQTTQLTLYSSSFAKLVYPLTDATPSLNESALVASIVVNPTAYGVPLQYQNSITGYVSPDHKVQLVTVAFTGTSDQTVNELRSLVSQQAPKYGLAGEVAVTGDQAISMDFRSSSFGDVNLILPVTIIIMIIATGLFFRSVVTPGVSLLSIGIALGIADSAIIYLVGNYVVGVDSNVPNILLSVMIGVGTDYSVFLLARYREERAKGKDKSEAVHTSVTWAGESIATSGLTVMISFFLLGTLQTVGLLRSLGLVVGLGVLVALAGSLTFIPSIVLMIPSGVFWPNVGKRFESYASKVENSIKYKTSYFSRSAGFSIKHAKIVVAVALIATIPSLYTWGTAPVGYDFLAAAPQNIQSVASFNAMSASFGSGKLFPTYVVLQFNQPIWNGSGYNLQEMKTIDAISNQTQGVANVLSVTGPTRPSGVRLNFDSLGNDTRSKLLESSINGMISKDGLDALLNIDFIASPESATSINTAAQLRQMYATFTSNSADGLQGIYLGGAAGSTLDSKNSTNSQFETVIAYVMAGVGVVLLLVLGSLFLPLFAIVSIVMSIAWTLATTDLVFRQLYNFPILFITPLTLFVLLLGLGMDYNIFILTRIREEAAKGAPLNTAITTAIERTGGIITAAALILAGSLGSLMLSKNLLLREFGFAFFFSILIDAMIMRTYVVPSVMSLMGKWNWYAPGRLQRTKMKSAT